MKFVPNTKHRDQQPTTGQLWNVPASSIGTCAIECYKDNNCTSFFLGNNKTNGPCIGYSGDIDTDNFGLLDAEGWSYFSEQKAPSTTVSPVDEAMTTALTIYTTAVIKKGNAGGNACQGSWMAFGSSCYRFSRSRSMWGGAKRKCFRDGGHLVSIESREEHEFIGQHLEHKMWMGANDKTKEGVWRWQGDGRKMNYTNWKPGEPSNGILFIVEDCAYIRREKGETLWVDYPCITPLYYICEKDMPQ
ncbi:hypothetical protein ScPMuIL_002824 [Solemya velum]